MTSSLKFDTTDLQRGMDALTGELKTKLARSMAVAGGEVIRDEAKARAPVDTGLLQSSIYLAFRDTRSTEERVMYSVSWNSKTAPHGHLLEFGHWSVTGGKTGRGGVQGTWVAARPFLRPAHEAAGARAVQAMLARGAARLPELLAEAVA